jgi:hypothetical protein
MGSTKVSYYHCVDVTYVFRFFRVCLMKLDALTLGAYRGETHLNTEKDYII